MFVFFSRCIIGLMIFVSPFTLLSAAGYVKYTPAPQISLSGSSSDARFDVAQVLYDSLSPISAPKLDTTTRTFSGAFYLSGAGWVLMNTGSYSTKLDCGAQYLSGLTSNCTLSGYAWSETIGDIVFDRRVQYIPTTGTLSGKISTYIGDISLDGVMLPLLPATLSGSTYTSMADHHTYIEVKNPQLYESSG